ncbi:MAG: DUF2804 domain-containing protein [Christensenellales bacterium]|jgi:hypothetical protein|nr:DUF2804 domain-containing protein [Clostridiales bacterium]
MSKEIKRTYVPYQEFPEKSKQIEYTAPTPLLAEDGTLLAKGWARRNYFDFDMKKVSKRWRKEWEFYLISNRKYLVIVSIATVAIGGFMDVSIVDLEKGENVESAGTLFFGNKCKLTDKGDEPGGFSFCANKTSLEVINTDRSREIHFRKGDDIYCDFQMDLFEDHESLTTVFPFHGDKKKFFLTTKQNSMPCAGTFVNGDKKYTFTKEDTFCCMDWGRVAAPRKFVWYWGNGSQYIYDDEGKRHIFGFEITWGIGDESYATETCLFYDGKIHKIGAVDVKVFPKPDKYMEPWHFISEDGRFNMTMTPSYDRHSDMNIASLFRMHVHQVFGNWNGTVILDDGTKLKIKDMHAFCEYVENKW